MFTESVIKYLEVGDFFCIGLPLRDSLGGHVQRHKKKKKKIVALFDRETNLLFLVSLMKLHRGMYTLKQFILMSISAMFGRDHSLLIA